MVSVSILCFPTPLHCSDTCIPYRRPKISARPPKFVLLPPASKQRKLYENSNSVWFPQDFPCNQAVSEQLLLTWQLRGVLSHVRVAGGGKEVAPGVPSQLLRVWPSALFPCLIWGDVVHTQNDTSSKAKPSWGFSVSRKWEEEKNVNVVKNPLSSAGAKAAPASEC